MVKTFPLNSRAKVTGLKQPKELFCFSREMDCEWEYDEQKVKSEKLPYYYLPDANINVDLQGGYSKFQKIPEEQNVGDFPALLEAIMRHEKKHGTKLAVDLISFRGLMTKILSIPYYSKDSVNLNIVAYDGQLFINSDTESELRKRKQELQERMLLPQDKQDYINRCEYSGYKFETMATLPRPWSDCSRNLIEKRGKKIVNNYEQYISVVKTGIGKVKMALAGEVDCIWDYIPDDNKDILSHYVELKTSRVIEHKGQMGNFERKLFKTWGQCFLMGIKKIVYGFRDDNFICRAVEIFETEEVPLLIKNNNNSEINCMAALRWYGAAIEWIAQEIDVGDETKSWRLCYDAGSRTFSLIELMGEENTKLRNGGMLSKEFKEWRQSLKKQEPETN
jgi:RAT1-interacting protein